MLFNTLEFAVFLPVIFAIYWFVANKNLKIQNAFLLFASYFFYCWWDWRFLALLVFNSFATYFIGKWLSETKNIRRRKSLLFTSIFFNLGLLLFFKYFDFFTESFAAAFSLFGKHIEAPRLNFILPIGISYYTFRTLSYSIDVYYKRIEHKKEIISFLAFISFFPQLVAGPIERAVNMLPQFRKKRTFNYANAVDGMRQILWGVFKKIVIADNCSTLVNDIFTNCADYSNIALVLGIFLFAFQIYCDFSGYSDIAIGTARLFGFNSMKNFSFPYFSRDISEFWKRWHISLSSWLMDYIYTPLSLHFRNWGKAGIIAAIIITFTICGFWHGASWTFIVWGFINACYFIPLIIFKRNKTRAHIVAKGKLFPGAKELIQIMTTFTITGIAWIFFKSNNLNEAFYFFKYLFINTGIPLREASFLQTNQESLKLLVILIMILFLTVVEWINRERGHGLDFKNPVYARLMYVVIFFFILYYGEFNETNFIYARF